MPPSLVGDICIKSIFAYDEFMGQTIPSYRLASDREKKSLQLSQNVCILNIGLLVSVKSILLP